MLFNLEETEEKVCKNGGTLEKKDNVKRWQIGIPNKRDTKITNVRESLFKSWRILKAIEIADIMENESCESNISEMESSVSSLKATKQNGSFC